MIDHQVTSSSAKDSHQSIIRHQLTIYVPCKDNPEILDLCLKNLLWADEILVADVSDGSDIKSLVAGMPCHVKHFPTRKDHLFDRIREVIPHASHEYILFVDSDEIYNQQLASEILAELAVPCRYSGFYIPQVFHSYGCEFGPGTAWLRLAKSSDMILPTEEAHGLLQVTGPTKQLKSPFTHLNNPKLGMTVVKHFRYSAGTSFKKQQTELELLRLDNLSQRAILLHASRSLLRICWRFTRTLWGYRHHRYAALCMAYADISRCIAEDISPTEECRMREGACERNNRGYF
jgi:hypothetical protein